MITDCHNLVCHGPIEGLWNEACPDSLDLVRPLGTTTKYRSLGFDRHRKQVGNTLLQKACHSGKRPAGTGSDHNRVYLALQLIVEFARRGLVVIVRIRLVLELSRDERVWSLGSEVLDQLDGALHAFSVGRANHLRPQGFHQHDLLPREALGHREKYLVATAASDERQPNPGIACSRLEDG